MERIQQIFPVSAVEAELSVWSRQALAELLPWCVARGVGLLAAMPLGSGYLTGTLKPGQGFEPEDLRARHPRFTAEVMAANQPVVAGLRRVAERRGATVAQVALAWVLRQGPHVVPVPGAKRERWAVENAGADRVVLEDRDLAEIDARFRPRGSRGTEGCAAGARRCSRLYACDGRVTGVRGRRARRRTGRRGPGGGRMGGSGTPGPGERLYTVWERVVGQPSKGSVPCVVLCSDLCSPRPCAEGRWPRWRRPPCC